jgi:hypothetical protein
LQVDGFMPPISASTVSDTPRCGPRPGRIFGR